MKAAGIDLRSEQSYLGKPVYWGDYICPGTQRIAERYCFVQTDYGFWREKIFHADEFISQITEPAFYQLRNDLRWNLYLVCVFEKKEFDKIPLEEYLEFEQNTEYTRNFLVEESAFLRAIPSGRVFEEKEGIETPTPWQDWNEILEQDGLGFCLGPYASTGLEEYLAFGKEKNAIKQEVDKQKQERVEKLLRLQLDETYRSDCFGRSYEIPFQRINLLDGRNGAGKTSILDAVELTLTGNVRKSRVQKRDGKEQGTELAVILGEREAVMGKPRNVESEKTRESSWYKSRRTSYGKSALNQMFHVHNYFTAEDTFLFAFSGEQPDYRKNFSNILFGEELGRCQHAWKAYLEDAKKQERQLQEKLARRKEEIESLQLDNVTAVAQVWDYWKHTGFAPLEEERLEKMREQVMAFLSAYDGVKDLEPLPGYEEVLGRNQYFLTESVEEKWLQERKNMAAEEQSRSILELEQEEEILQKYRKLNQKGEELKVPLTLFRYLGEHGEVYPAYVKLLEELARIPDHLWESYGEFYRRYRELGKLEERYPDIKLEAGQYEERKAEYQDLVRQHELAKLELEQEQKRLGEIQKLKELLRGYGREYVEKAEHLECCPLCGNRDTDRTRMRMHLEQDVDETSERFQMALEKSRSLDARKELAMEKLERSRKKRELLGTIKEAQEAIEKLEKREDNDGKDQEEPLEIPLVTNYGGLGKQEDPLQSIKRTLVHFEKLQEEREKLLAEKRKLEKNVELKLPDLSGEELERIPAYMDQTKEFLEIVKSVDSEKEKSWSTAAALSLAVRASAAVLGWATTAVIGVGAGLLFKLYKGNQFQQLADNLSEILKEIGNRERVEAEQVEKRKEQVAIAQKKQVDVQETWLKYQGQRAESEQKQKRLCRFWEAAEPLLRQKDAGSVQEAYGQAIRLKTMLEEENSGRVLLERKEKLESESRNLKEKLAAYQRISNTLQKLKTSEEYAEDFIRENIRHISHIFLNLHSPREFSELRLNGEGELIAVRRGEEIPIYRMSTGQKTAVALSVFLKMNLNAQDAPNFIMLDEPVANIDDMNVLAMLDFLREIAFKTDRQIFFTTANYNVAKLFRRKFSCMGEGFQELSFDRREGMKTRILRKAYDMETCILKEEL